MGSDSGIERRADEAFMYEVGSEQVDCMEGQQE